MSWRSCSAEFSFFRSVVLVCMLYIAGDLTIITVSHPHSVRKARCDSFYIMKRPKLLWSWALDKGWGPGAREMLSASLRPSGLCVFACMRTLLCVWQHALVYLCVCACVCICISLLGTLSILTRKLCLHFHFPSPAGPSPNLPWQLLSTRQAWSPLPNPPSVLCRLAQPHMLAS